MKKCKNFLVTLIKLASSDPQAAGMANNVRVLVRDLLVCFPSTTPPTDCCDLLWSEMWGFSSEGVFVVAPGREDGSGTVYRAALSGVKVHATALLGAFPQGDQSSL